MSLTWIFVFSRDVKKKLEAFEKREKLKVAIGEPKPS